jgi:pantoate--beta-alanine ligase
MRMRVITSVGEMQRLAQRWRTAGRRIGFVPTMGCLHAGHLSLMLRARREVGARGKVVASIYVNPSQFGPNEDFARYPRDLKRDARLCRSAGVDVVFAPTDRQMYPDTPGRGFSTWVVEERLSQRMEGASRPGHFRGVTTVVAKLFNIVQPHVAVFGAKDYQQAMIIRRMVADLNFAVKLTLAPTVRDRDGLAMSSRNRFLAGNRRAPATVLWRTIQKARELVRRSRSLPAARLKAHLKRMIAQEPAVRLDYVEFFDPATLVPVTRVTRGTHLALAAFVGTTRLIDNARL